jgi:nitroreductase
MAVAEPNLVYAAKRAAIAQIPQSIRPMKQALRSWLVRCQTCYSRYLQIKYQLEVIHSLMYFLYDLRNTWSYMRWGRSSKMQASQLQAKLLFYYHKIEKGLCMPGKRRLFGLEALPHITDALTTWEKSGNPLNDPIYVGAISSLESYLHLLEDEGLDPSNKVRSKVKEFLLTRTASSLNASTPISLLGTKTSSPISYSQFGELCQMRRSFRDFEDKIVSPDSVRKAVELAQLSPSACNRQPCKVYWVQNPSLKSELLSHQNGNAGFGHLAPVVMVITADASHFFGAIERQEPYIDGGLFSMSLLYGLQVQGLVSCCLNWCVEPAVDAKVHALLNISMSERIIMLMAAGHPKSETHVPRSHRKSIDNVLIFK